MQDFYIPSKADIPILADGQFMPGLVELCFASKPEHLVIEDELVSERLISKTLEPKIAPVTQSFDSWISLQKRLFELNEEEGIDIVSIGRQSEFLDCSIRHLMLRSREPRAIQAALEENAETYNPITNFLLIHLRRYLGRRGMIWSAAVCVE